jgi:GDP-4-dehydro-6-deoxy-D-mannose reductase
MRRPHAFITGIAGFAGSFLAEELLRSNYTVTGSILEHESTENIEHLADRIWLEQLDVLDSHTCRSLLERLKPDYVFHLAAIASVGKSFDLERLTFRVNFHGTLNMLEAARQARSLKKFLFVGSADAYGIFKPENKTLSEGQPLNPISPYGIGKAAAEYAVRYYYRQYELPVVTARSFNHSGPRQTEHFVIPAFARQIVAIEMRAQEPILRVGDLSTRRDFSDVRDIVRGYRLIAEKGQTGEVYQLCSGRAVSIRKVLDTLVGKSSQKIKVETDPARLRKSDIPVLRGSNRKAASEVGFKNDFRLSDTLADTLNYWRERLQRENKLIHGS